MLPNKELVLKFLLALYGLSLSIQDSIFLVAYILLTLYYLIFFYKDYVRNIKFYKFDIFPISLTIWRIINGFLKANNKSIVLQKAFKFLFDISPIFVFRSKLLFKYSQVFINTFITFLTIITILATLSKIFGIYEHIFFKGGDLVFKHKNHIKSGTIWSIAALVSLSLGLFISRIYLFLFVILGYGLLLTESRSYYLGFFTSIGFLMLILFLKYSENRKKHLTLTLLPLTITILFLYLIPSVKERFLSIFTKLNTDGSIKCRLIMWEEGLKAFLENPIMGIGYTNWKEFFEHPHCPDYHAHNVYIHELTETGIIGLLLLIGFLLSLFAYLFKNFLKIQFTNKYNESIALSAILVLVNVSVGAFFEPAFVKTAVLLPSLTIIGLGLIAMENEKE